MPTAYSYLRFSDADQKAGSSIRRQQHQRDEWLARNPTYQLDETIRLSDMGVSAFRGRNLNPKYGDLGKFIDLCEREDSPIEKGSVLLLEKLDRFSRNEPMLAIAALSRLIYSPAGIRVIATEDKLEIDTTNINKLDVILPTVLKLCIAHEQSAEKSYRVGLYWQGKRDDLQNEKKILTTKIPSWLKLNADKTQFKVIQHKADAIRFIYKRTVDGLGQITIAKELTDKFPAITSTKNKKERSWNLAYISKLLKDRSVLGEFQPMKKTKEGKRINAGKVIKDYYPRIIEDEVFYAAQFEKQKRKKEKSEQKSNFINLLTGLILNADDQSPMHILTSRTKRKTGETYIQRRLYSVKKRYGYKQSAQLSVDYYPLEEIVIKSLVELTEKDFKGRQSASKEKLQLQTTIDGLRQRKQELTDQLTSVNANQAVPEIASAIEEITTSISKAELRLNAILATDDDDDNTKPLELATLKKYCSTRENDGDPSIRQRIKKMLPLVIDRIELTSRRRPNRSVITTGTIFLKNDQIREFTVWKDKNFKLDEDICYFGKNDKPAIKLTPVGSIKFSGWHGSGQSSTEIIDKYTALDQNTIATANWTETSDLLGNIVWHGVEGHICDEEDLETLNRYLVYEGMAFDEASPEFATQKED